jgi:hypothetical protein
MAEPVGFEFYFRHHLSRHSPDFAEISANARLGNHVEARSELFGCGQIVGKPFMGWRAVMYQDMPDETASGDL